MKFRFKRQKNKSGMMNKNKRTKNLNGRMKFKVKIMKCSFSGKQLNQIWNSHVRQSYDEIPPKVKYSLSEKGRSIIPIFEMISKWGAKYYVDDARILQKSMP